MSSFSDQAFRSKLKDLNSTQQSIQTISLWAIHHRKHHDKIVPIWMEELLAAMDAARKLTLLYFANDVIQNGRKKGPEYQDTFRAVLAEAIDNALKAAKLIGDEKCMKGITRLVTVWRERTIFDEIFLNKLDSVVKKSPVAASAIPVSTASSQASPTKTEDATQPSKRILIDPADFQAFVKKSKASEKKDEHVDSDEEEYDDTVVLPPASSSSGSNGNSNEPETPKLQTLLLLIQKLQAAPSANAATRSKIADLPSVITDCGAIDQLTNREEINKLIDVAKDGLQTVMEYNKELHQELLDRQAVATELSRQLAYHRRVIEEKEKLREDLTQEISARRAFRDKLRVHVDSLPDLTQMTTSHLAKSVQSSTYSSSSQQGVKSKADSPSASHPLPYSRSTFPLK